MCVYVCVCVCVCVRVCVWRNEGLTLAVELPDDGVQEGVLRGHVAPPDRHLFAGLSVVPAARAHLDRNWTGSVALIQRGKVYPRKRVSGPVRSGPVRFGPPTRPRGRAAGQVTFPPAVSLSGTLILRSSPLLLPERRWTHEIPSSSSSSSSSSSGGSLRLF
ncbi:hypothetical protein EYF80_060898 [Liparis tanakae]|uniref:Secreted protein n=1 Tax=Liparis tanakae TaxID=230148 RepID=A0A4Z2EJF4_9TELE|nr:hypothetical protein EYF80_060898 [Liparis tanakae]